MRWPSPDRARTILRAVRGRRVLVLGDVMLDEFIWGRVARISPEAPVPVVEVVKESLHLGGAGNVAQNVRSLGGDAVLAGVIGADGAGQKVRAELAAAGIVDALFVARDDRPTTVKTRVIAHQQQVVRADRERTDPISGALERELIDCLRRTLADCQALIVSDYNKGVLTPRVARELFQAARRRKIQVFVDPKVRHLRLYRPITAITPNQLEAERMSGVPIRCEADLLRAGEVILKRLGCDALLLTRGEHGMSLFRRGERPLHIPAFAREVYEVTGAGDTVMATFALTRCSGARMEEAAFLANCAASIVVGKVGTATTTPKEIAAMVRLVAARPA